MGLPDLGVGVIYLPGLEPLVEAGQELLDVVEIEPQTFWSRYASEYRHDEAALSRIERIPHHKLVHGVGFPVGGTVPPDPAAVRKVSATVRRLSAPWASEHLSFNRVAVGGGGYGTLFLLPPLQTADSVAAAVRNIASVKSELPVPFAFETGVNYLRPQRGELSDGAFFATVAEEADCGILLDLHNLWCNERNGRQSVLDALAEMPLDRVWEVHLAGGQEVDGYWLDAHSGPVPEALFELAARVIPTLPNLHAVIFELMPAYLSTGRVTITDAIRQLERIRLLWESRGGATSAPRTGTQPGAAAPAGPLPAPSTWESTLGRAVLGDAPAAGRADLPVTGDGASVEADPGTGVIRKILGRARAGMIAEILPQTVRLVLLSAGEDRLRELLARFWRTAAPEQFAGLEAEAFGQYLLCHGGDIPHLADIVALELAVLRARGSGTTLRVLLGCDPVELLRVLAAGSLPDGEARAQYDVVVPAS